MCVVRARVTRVCVVCAVCVVCERAPCVTALPHGLPRLSSCIFNSLSLPLHIIGQSRAARLLIGCMCNIFALFISMCNSQSDAPCC